MAEEEQAEETKKIDNRQSKAETAGGQALEMLELYTVGFLERHNRNDKGPNMAGLEDSLIPSLAAIFMTDSIKEQKKQTRTIYWHSWAMVVMTVCIIVLSVIMIAKMSKQ